MPVHGCLPPKPRKCRVGIRVERGSLQYFLKIHLRTNAFILHRVVIASWRGDVNHGEPRCTATSLTASPRTGATVGTSKLTTSFRWSSVVPMSWPTCGHNLIHPQAGVRQKNVLENYFHRQVCSGLMDIESAQQEIARDWFAAWKKTVTSSHRHTIRVEKSQGGPPSARPGCGI